jgi:beta-phosphoglucomutase-like phosphatase (HAD superfamily)
MMKYEAFFFDFDGVLADSMQVKTRAFARLFEAYGSEIEAKVVEHHLHHGGMSRMEKFRHYYRDFLGEPLSGQQMADLCQRFSQLVVDQVVAAPEIPGAGEFLRLCRNRLPCFVVSATPEEEIINIVQRRGWTGYFREVRGAPAKKGENLDLLLRRYLINPEGCLFFGDAESDYRAARECGMPFLGILPGPGAPLLQVAPEIAWVRDFYEAPRRLGVG